MKSKAKKILLFITVPLAVILLILGYLYFNDYFYIVKPPQEILTELKPGKYYLLRNDGLDKSIYAEVFPDKTICFTGVEEKGELLEDGSGLIYNWNEPTPYQLSETVPFIGIETVDGEGERWFVTGISYLDENTFFFNFPREGNEDIPDFNHEANDPDTYKYDEKIIMAHLIYEGAEE